MFTLKDIHEAHKKVKTGADFPQYIRDIIILGVAEFQTSVIDGQTLYMGGDELLASPPLHENITINPNTDKEKFIEQLRIHQSGGTDFLTFCQDCASSGIDHWVVKTHKHTCTYYSHTKEEVLMEHFPS